MTTDAFLHVIRESLFLALLLSAPALLAATAVGFVVSVLQAATQVQEQTLSATPKIAAVIVALAVCGYWMLDQLRVFAVAMFRLIVDVGLPG